jgi:hypothetical protein
MPRQPPQGPGQAVDAHGGPVVDPTKNVEDLVRAGEVTNKALRAADNRFIDAQLESSEKLQNFAREAQGTLQNFAREAGEKLNKALLDAETRRIDQLADTRQKFQDTIRDMLAESVRTTSTLVSTQLVQIQATFDTRVSKLEAYQFTQAGRSSVADPALADFMRAMSSSLSTQANSTTDLIAKMSAENTKAMATLTATVTGLGSIEKQGEGRRMGQGQVIAWIVAGFMLLAAVAGPIIAIVSMKGH